MSASGYAALTGIAECYKEALSLLTIFTWLGYKIEDMQISIENDRMMGVDLIPAKLSFLTGKIPDQDWDPDDSKVIAKMTSRWHPYVTSFNELTRGEQRRFVEASKTYELREQLRKCLLQNGTIPPAWTDA